jgi:hypothetical protein
VIRYGSAAVPDPLSEFETLTPSQVFAPAEPLGLRHSADITRITLSATTIIFFMGLTSLP